MSVMETIGFFVVIYGVAFTFVTHVIALWLAAVVGWRALNRGLKDELEILSRVRRFRANQDA